MTKSLSLLFATTFLFTSSVGASDVEKHKQEAKDLCEVYNPDNWVEFFKSSNPSTTEIYSEIGKRIRKVATTDDFKAIYQDIYDKYHPDVYNFTKERVSKLIGEKWECDYYRNFYFPRKEIVLDIDAVDKKTNPLLKRNEIKVLIDSEGKLYINSDEALSPDKALIRKSIGNQPNYKQANIVIYADAKAPQQSFVSVVSTLSEMGFRKVSIATQ
jgi:biopolymer transport protein ExbD